jgi:hypothetical protein
LTVPLPVPDAPLVRVIHPALLTALHAQAAATVTVTLPVAAPAGTVRLVGEMFGAHGAEYENWFELLLSTLPPGPTADTRASKLTPGVGCTGSKGRKSTRITPAPFGAGLPRFTVANGVAVPTGKIASE